MSITILSDNNKDYCKKEDSHISSANKGSRLLANYYYFIIFEISNIFIDHVWKHREITANKGNLHITLLQHDKLSPNMVKDSSKTHTHSHNQVYYNVIGHLQSPRPFKSVLPPIM